MDDVVGDKTLILITGEHRSGTTLLSKLLDAQDHVRVWRDYNHIDRYLERLDVASLIEPLSEENKRSLLTSFARETVLAHGRTLPWTTEAFDTLLSFYVGNFARISRASDVVVGHKSTRCYGCISELLRELPALRIVFMIRDPRAVVPSEIRRLRRHDPDAIIARWLESIASWERLADEGPRHRLHLLRYEDLVTDPKNQTKTLAAFLGLPSMDPGSKMTEGSVSWAGNSSFDANLVGIDSAPADRWRHDGDRELCELIEQRAGKSMSQFGYEPLG